MDKKMQMFLDAERTKRTIEHGVDKQIPRATLSIFSDPRGRLIVADAMEQGRYQIQPPKIILIPKKHSTEKRKVYANNPMDRFVLSQIDSVYYELYKDMIHPNCVSYQKGIGVGKIIKKIVSQLNQNLSGYKADLSKYFDSVNLETIEDYLMRMNTDSPLDKILWDYYHDNRVIDEEGKEVERYKSLAQGCAFGTLLANVVLNDIDAALSELDILYYRYSDDLLILGNDADKAMTLLGEMLLGKGLTLNPKKVDRISNQVPFTFLGFTICGKKISLSEDSVDNFKDEIKRITHHGKGIPIHDRRIQEKAISRINNYLYNDHINNQNEFGWMEYFAPITNDATQMEMLDEYAKDHLKAMYTGKWNHTTNRHKTSNKQLQEMGYRSMVHMWKLRNICKAVYETEVRVA